MWAWTPLMSWRPNKVWIRSRCGSGWADPLTPCAATSRALPLSSDMPVEVSRRCTDANPAVSVVLPGTACEDVERGADAAVSLPLP